MSQLDLEVLEPVPDLPLEEVAAEIERLDPDGTAWASVIRHTYDMVYNGQETGRYRWDQLMKTEKTHFGTLFEINAQRKFEFEGGDKTDFRIAGHEVDAKWSQTMGAWMLPPEVFGRIALVATGSDPDAKWSVGLVRVRPEYLRVGVNRDQKSGLNSSGREAIRWLWKDAPLPPNALLQLSDESIARIFDSKSSGAKRVRELFVEAEGKIVSRTVVATVAQQLDAQKRVRGNGGARSKLQPLGYVILSGVFHAHIAEALDVEIPRRDEYISVRVVPTNDDSGALIDGTRWRRAREDESATIAAPTLPERGVREE